MRKTEQQSEKNRLRRQNRVWLIPFTMVLFLLFFLSFAVCIRAQGGEVGGTQVTGEVIISEEADPSSSGEDSDGDGSGDDVGEPGSGDETDKSGLLKKQSGIPQSSGQAKTDDRNFARGYFLLTAAAFLTVLAAVVRRILCLVRKEHKG
ncbi:MAG: hypothetical protein LUC83_03770 [Clostridiales bacterium]|nr:hypothetical protein [Clostridiales bacterium]